MVSNGDLATINLRLDRVHLLANVTGPRLPWTYTHPDTDGPEGWLARTGLLPCHYFVHSFSSPTSYVLHRAGRSSVSSSGRNASVHIERNYGDAFPSGWVWAQASAPRDAAHLVLTGGRFQIGPFETLTYIIALRAPVWGVAWNFRSTDLDRISDVRWPCRGELRINASSFDQSRRLLISLSAPKSTFGRPFHIPTHTGFSNVPGCRESYNATATLSAYHRVHSMAAWSLVGSIVISFRPARP